MDNTQLGLLVGVIIAANGSFSALLVALVNRSNNRKANSDPWDGRERRGDGWHSAPCPYVTSLITGIEQVRADIEALRANLVKRIDALYERER